MPHQLSSRPGWWSGFNLSLKPFKANAVLGMIKRAESLGGAGNFKESQRALGEILKQDPSCAWALFYAAGLSLLEGKPKETIAYLTELEKSPAENFCLYPELSLPPQLCEKRCTDAVEELALVQSKLPWAQVLRAVTLRYHLNYAEALYWMERAKRAGGGPIILALYARFQLNSNAKPGDEISDSALNHLALAAEKAPKAGWIAAWQGEALRHRKEFPQALNFLNHALKSEPAYSPARVWRGAVLRALGQADLALKDLTLGLSEHLSGQTVGGTDGLWAWALHERHLALRDLKQWEEAANSLSDAHEINARYLWRSPWAQQKNSALSDLEEGLILNPNSAALLSWKGKTLLDEGRPEEALLDLKAACRRAPDFYFSWCWLGGCHSALGQLKEARAALEKSLALKPDYASSLLLYGNILAHKNKLKEALSYLDKACQADSVNAQAFAARGKCKALLGLKEEAAEDFRQALLIYPKLQEAKAALDEEDFSKQLQTALARAGCAAQLPKSLSVFFPSQDGRQDILHRQDFGLSPFFKDLKKAKAALLRASFLSFKEKALFVGYCDLFLGGYETALKNFRRAENDFFIAVALWLLGDQKRTRRLLGSTLEAVEKALIADPNNKYLFAIRCNTYREMENIPARLQDAEKLIELDPSFVWARVERLETLGETGRYKDALKEANALLRQFPKKGWAWAQRGRLHGFAGYFDLALKDFDRALALEPSGSVLAWKGETLRRLGRFSEAVSVLKKSISLDNGYAPSHVWMGRCLLQKGDFKNALAYFDRALKKDSREVLAQAWKAESLWKLGRFQESFMAFEKIYPLQAQLTWNARLQERQTQASSLIPSRKKVSQDREAAFWRDLNSAVRENPKNAWAWAFRGRCYVSAGKNLEGLMDLSKALEISPSLARAYAWRGEALRVLGFQDRALVDFKEALRLEPANRWAWAWKGRTQSDLHQYDQALRCFKRALEGNAEYRFAPVCVWRAAIYWKIGRLAEARAEVDHALALDGKCEEALRWINAVNVENERKDSPKETSGA